jgi:hypothetical protein
MAVLAVGRQSPSLINRGLVALVIEGASQDVRDSIVAVAKLYHSAVKMGIDAQAAFGNAASFADAGLIKTELKHFASRGPKDRDISAFYWTEEGDGENFRYKQVLPGSLRRRFLPDSGYSTSRPIGPELARTLG